MYTLYTDKPEDFKCHIGVQGADLTTTTVRLILENKKIDLIFEGKIQPDGTCVIPIKKLKGILEEGLVGNMKLEVIADETFFNAWEDEFLVKTSKKIVVEVENDEKDLIIEEKIQITVEKQKIPKTFKKPKKTHSTILAEVLNLKGIKRSNLKENIDIVSPIIERYIKRFNVETPEEELLSEVINKLEK